MQQSQAWLEEGAQPTYPNLVRRAGELYLAEMSTLAADSPGSLHESAALLALTLGRAVQLGPDLTPHDVHFDPAVAAIVPQSDWDRFLNEWMLGFGSDSAPVIVLGTEAADTWREPQDLAWQAGLAVVFLSHGRLDVMRRLIEGSSWSAKVDWLVPRRPYTVHPYDLFPPGRGRSTWLGLAQVVCRETGTGATLLHRGGPSPSLGDLTYQIDRSAFPSKQWVGGRAPTSARLDWLRDEVIPTLCPTARVLLLCGGGGRWGAAWEQLDQPLMRAFLGLPPGALLDLTWDPSLKTELGHCERDGRLVVSSRALGGSMTGHYLERLRSLILPFVY